MEQLKWFIFKTQTKWEYAYVLQFQYIPYRVF